ncbi:hypothetical protein HZB58_00970 [Candidatus Gottesmanbacteria bacterium]|nr:hypothetical protein [Candidatus Gottesmanbacteria bacterium]
MRIIVLFFLSLALAFATHPVYAAKPRVKSVTGTKNTATIATGYSTAKLSRNTNSVVVTFLNLKNVSKITYTLSYTANGIEQGVVGSLTPSGTATDVRDLYFGTCSHGVCTAHRGIQKAMLVIETKLTSGKTHVKRYRIKI